MVAVAATSSAGRSNTTATDPHLTGLRHFRKGLLYTTLQRIALKK